MSPIIFHVSLESQLMRSMRDCSFVRHIRETKRGGDRPLISNAKASSLDMLLLEILCQKEDHNSCD